MKFILIMYVWSGYGTTVAVSPIPFETRIACETAAQQFLSAANGGVVKPAKAFCATNQ